MTRDLGAMKQRLVRMTVISTLITLVAVAFAIAHFVYRIDWALWAFVGLLGLVLLAMWRGAQRFGAGEPRRAEGEGGRFVDRVITD